DGAEAIAVAGVAEVAGVAFALDVKAERPARILQGEHLLRRRGRQELRMSGLDLLDRQHEAREILGSAPDASGGYLRKHSPSSRIRIAMLVVARRAGDGMARGRRLFCEGMAHAERSEHLARDQLAERHAGDVLQELLDDPVSGARVIDASPWHRFDL